MLELEKYLQTFENELKLIRENNKYYSIALINRNSANSFRIQQNQFHKIRNSILWYENKFRVDLISYVAPAANVQLIRVA